MQVLPALNSGGVERGAIDIANFVVKNGYKSIIVSAGGRLEVFLKKDVLRIKMDVNSKNPFVIFRNVKKIRALILEHQVDILHARSRAPAWSCLGAVKGTGCKYLATFHGTYSITSFLKKEYNKIMLKGSKVIAVSNHIKQHIKDCYKGVIADEKIEVIHRGVDVELFNQEKIYKEVKIGLIKKWQIPDDKKIIMLPGRITFWKGHEFLIDALSLLKRDDYLCLFVGDFAAKTNYKRRLEDKIAKCNLQGKVKFVGTCNNMPVAYSICDVIVSASIEPEAFGRIAIEAQSMCKIIVATGIGGSKETVIDKKTGFLVDLGDVKKMSSRINYVLNLDEDTRNKIGTSARKNVIKNFSNDLMCKKTLAVYQDLFKSD
jgi:glycosyltransferase involved in cell wall biosynthesis